MGEVGSGCLHCKGIVVNVGSGRDVAEGRGGGLVSITCSHGQTMIIIMLFPRLSHTPIPGSCNTW
jgi:hypothetical protein